MVQASALKLLFYRGRKGLLFSENHTQQNAFGWPVVGEKLTQPSFAPVSYPIYFLLRGQPSPHRPGSRRGIQHTDEARVSDVARPVNMLSF
jgi:hypothetical protein